MFEHSEQDAATNCSLHRTETLIRTCSCDIHTYNYTTLLKCARYKAKDRQEHIHLTFKSFQMRLPIHDRQKQSITRVWQKVHGWVMTVQPTGLSTSQPVLTFNNSCKQHCHRRQVSYLHTSTSRLK